MKKFFSYAALKQSRNTYDNGSGQLYLVYLTLFNLKSKNYFNTWLILGPLSLLTILKLKS